VRTTIETELHAAHKRATEAVQHFIDVLMAGYNPDHAGDDYFYYTFTTGKAICSQR
jgi:hypothetical protein